MAAVGVPIRLLHEGEGHTVSIELRNGEIYRGTLNEAEDTMNCMLDNVSRISNKLARLQNALSMNILTCSFHKLQVTMTARDGRVSKLETVYIRGSQIKMMILPEMLKNSPAFGKVQTMKRKHDDKDAKLGKGRKKN
jgi:small nuclear ribonucleoprotein D3